MGHKFLMFVGCLIPLAVSVEAISPIEARAAVPSLPPPVDIRVDLDGLPTSERRALAKIIQAARRLDEIYMQQVWPGTPQLLAARQASHSSQGKAELRALYYYILNRLFDAGALHIDGAGRFVINSVKADAAVVTTARQFVSLMAKGDTRGVHAQLVRYGSIRPDVAAIVRRIVPRPMGPPEFTTADELVSAAVQQ
jgi:hypothetical protein